MENQTIDITPTWGETFGIFMLAIEAGNPKARDAMRPELARALAAAQALNELMPTLSDEQKAQASGVLTRELSKMGY